MKPRNLHHQNKKKLQRFTSLAELKQKRARMYELAGSKQDMRSLSTISYTMLVEGTLPANHML